MTDERATVRRILERVAPEVDADLLDGERMIQEQVDFDSLDFLHLVEAIGEAAATDIPERDYPQLATLDGAAAYLRGLRSPGSDRS